MASDQSLKIEKFFFQFSRVFALVGSIVALVIAVVALSSLFSSDTKTYVSIDEVTPPPKQTQAESTAPDQAPAKPSIKIDLPKNVETYLAGENLPILSGWLKPLDEDQKEDFLANLSVIIQQAEENKYDVIKTINQYKVVKLGKVEANQFSKYERLATKGALISVLFGAVFIIAVFSLVLVLVAIERNTRLATSEAGK